jgi:protoheme IX farnesyltransferase
VHTLARNDMQKVSYYIELVKPKLTAMALLSGALGYLAAASPGQDIPWITVVHLVLALALVGAASNIMNQAMEHKLDSIMDRTSDRPIPSGKVEAQEAKIFSVICLVAGLVYLQLYFEPLVVLLAFLTYISYVLIYTPMKTKSSLNTVAGAFPGALPVLIGWVACRGEPDFHGFVVFAVVFIWQLPHFFSIAWIYKEDYKKAGYKMMSLYDETGKQAVILIVVGTLGLIAVSFIPFLVKHTGDLYLVGCFPANALLLATSLLLLKDRNKYMKLYFYGSITWLPYILILMVVDRLI